jgi:hypothetical protein
MTINDITKYKKALIYVRELSKLETIISKALNELAIYKKYLPVQNCMETLTDNLTVVQVHLNHQKKIVESKGSK